MQMQSKLRLKRNRKRWVKKKNNCRLSSTLFTFKIHSEKNRLETCVFLFFFSSLYANDYLIIVCRSNVIVCSTFQKRWYAHWIVKFPRKSNHQPNINESDEHQMFSLQLFTRLLFYLFFSLFFAGSFELPGPHLVNDSPKCLTHEVRKPI